MYENAREFMQGHADKSCAGRTPEVLDEATPKAIEQARELLAGFPYPPKANTVVGAGRDGDDHVFDVTYTSKGGTSVSLREWVRSDGLGAWKIVKVEKPE